MRKELAEIKEIEAYVFNEMCEADRALFNVRLLINPHLEEQLTQQRKLYRLVRFFGRKEQRLKLEMIFEELANDKSFSQQLKTIFG